MSKLTACLPNDRIFSPEVARTGPETENLQFRNIQKPKEAQIEINGRLHSCPPKKQHPTFLFTKAENPDELYNQHKTKCHSAFAQGL